MSKIFRELIKIFSNIFSKETDLKPSTFGISKDQAFELLKGKKNLKDLEVYFYQENDSLKKEDKEDKEGKK